MIFLDCDGVVSPLHSASCFHPPQMRMLRTIVEATGAEIVLSSSWRTTDWGRQEVSKHLLLHGMKRFIDITPDEPGISRAKEILKWIAGNSGKYRVVNFVALDDINLPACAPDREFFARHAVTTNGLSGLTEADVSKAITMMQPDNDIHWEWDSD